MLRLSELSIVESKEALRDIPDGKVKKNQAIKFNFVQLSSSIVSESDYLWLQNRMTIAFSLFM